IDLTTQKSLGLDVGIEQMRIHAHSKFCNQTLAQMQIRTLTRVIVLAIRKAQGEMLFNPPADAKVEQGDYLIAMGEPDGLGKLGELWGGGAKPHPAAGRRAGAGNFPRRDCVRALMLRTLPPSDWSQRFSSTLILSTFKTFPSMVPEMVTIFCSGR